MWTIDKQIEIGKMVEGELDGYESEYLDLDDDLGGPFEVIRLKELTIANLADYHDTNLAASVAWRKVTSIPSLTDLKLFITSEDDTYYLYGNGTYSEEKYEFFGRLSETWLSPCISDNLRILSLYSYNYWGWFPKMDFRGIEFPQLRVLALGHYVFSHDWQIDWFASIGQKNDSGGLEELYLDDCPILYKAHQASPLDYNDLGYPSVSTVMDRDRPDTYKYSMRWYTVLSRWAMSMKALRVFRMGHGEWETPQDTLESFCRDQLYAGVDYEVISHRVSHNTHRSFACPEPVDAYYGNLSRSKCWASGKYLQGTGINEFGGCKMQYITYDINLHRPWKETFRSYTSWERYLSPPLKDCKHCGYQPEKGTHARDYAAFEELTSATKARVIKMQKESEG